MNFLSYDKRFCFRNELSLDKSITMVAKALDVLRVQSEFNNSVIKRNIEGISHEESVVFPNGETNPINWVLGHLIFVRNAMIEILGGNHIWNDDELSFYNRGEIPVQHKEKFPDFEMLKNHFNNSETELNRVINLRENIASETLEDLAALMLHEIYHAGQLGYIRRIIGKEGAIK